MTRKSKLTPEVIQTMYEHHCKGVPIKYCCDFAGVSRASYYNWIKRGEEGDEANDGLYIELNDAMRKARAYAIQHYISKIYENPNPNTLIFMLRMLDPDTFNIPHRTQSVQNSYHRLDKLFSNKQIKKIAKQDKEE